MLGVDVIPERVVIDQNRITGAGITSGIDLGLTLVSLLCGDDIAKITQLLKTEYSISSDWGQDMGSHLVK